MSWLNWWKRKEKTTRPEEFATVDRSAEKESSESFVAMFEQFGRQYLADVPYMLPKDAQEGKWLDFQHYMLRAIMRGLYVSPLVQPRQILDVGCGTGRWAIEMASQFPQANVIGLDIVPPQTSAGAPKEVLPWNYSFVSGDVFKGLPFPDATFDFVHMRLMVFAIPGKDWPNVVRELVRVTRPGGWVECLEGDLLGLDEGPDMDQLCNWVIQACSMRGIERSQLFRIGDMMRYFGLANVTSQVIPVPAGPHAGRVGLMVASDWFAILEGLKPDIVRAGITTTTEFDRTLSKARVSINQSHCIFPFPLAYGQRAGAQSAQSRA